MGSRRRGDAQAGRESQRERRSFGTQRRDSASPNGVAPARRAMTADALVRTSTLTATCDSRPVTEPWQPPQRPLNWLAAETLPRDLARIKLHLLALEVHGRSRFALRARTRVSRTSGSAAGDLDPGRAVRMHGDAAERPAPHVKVAVPSLVTNAAAAASSSRQAPAEGSPRVRAATVPAGMRGRCACSGRAGSRAAERRDT